MGRRVQKKLKSEKGESLIELLASILVASLSVVLLAGMVAVSSRINRSVRESDAAFYGYVSEAEAQTEEVTAPAAQLQIQEEGAAPILVKITCYGEEDSGVYSYKKTN